jgi:hypothetical protein
MRMLLRVKVPVEAGNRAIKDGTLARVLRQVAERVQPEASYALAENGQRAAYMFFDMKDPSMIPEIAEPIFMSLNAELELIPVMNMEELQKGLEAAAKSF